MMIENLMLTAISGAVTLVLGVLANILAARLKKQSEIERKKAGDIADVVKSEEAARKASAVETLIQKLPDGANSVHEVLAAFEKLVAQVPPAPAAEQGPRVSAVEDLISGYHEQALGQARIQFYFSVVAATVGFAWIIYSAREIEVGKLATVFKTLPGVVMDAVAFLFFRQASETRQRATELYDRLRKDKQLSEARSLVESIEDVKIRSTVQAQIALHMSGLAPTPIDLMRFTAESPTHNQTLRRTGRTERSP